VGDFDGKVAIVTGAASGIGRASARLFAQRGASVVVADIDATGGAETAKLVNDDGGRAVFQETDVAKPDEVERMVLRAVGEFGRLDFAHNNAGIAGAGAPIPDYPLHEWYRGIDVMLNGVFLGMRFEIPAILASGGGAIVNTASGAGLIGFPGMSAYVAAKHGVIGLTKTAALEYGAQGVRINAICPGTAYSRMVDDWLQGDPENLAQVAGLHPIGRIANPEEIAEAAIWLCSDGASFMLGAAIPVDGGYTAQ
jgi:NAD(P)-dependent dehydrogenase (short-subunit alcohol dehydrogenase family)